MRRVVQRVQAARARRLEPVEQFRRRLWVGLFGAAVILAVAALLG